MRDRGGFGPPRLWLPLLAAAAAAAGAAPGWVPGHAWGARRAASWARGPGHHGGGAGLRRGWEAAPRRAALARPSTSGQEPGAPPALGAAPPPVGSGAAGGATRVPVARVAPRRFKILFTCRICERRNENLISRIAYGHGIVVVTCPGCTNRHLISDKTGLLQRGRWDVEMLAGENVTRLGGSGLLQVQGGDGRDALRAPPDSRGLDTPGLLVRRRGGVTEAVLEGGVSTSLALEFLAPDG